MFCRIDPCWNLDAAVASRLSEMEIKVAVIVEIVQGQRLHITANLIRVWQPMRDRLKHSRAFICGAISDDVELIAANKDDFIKPIVIDIEHRACPGSRRIELGRLEEPRVFGWLALWRCSGG